MKYILLTLILINVSFANERLFEALDDSSSSDLKEIIDTDSTIDFNFRNDYGNSILMKASYLGMATLVRYLLSIDGINLDAINGNTESALNIAIKRHSVNCALLLVDAGAELNSTDSRGATALLNSFGALQGRPLIHALIKAGANVNIGSIGLNKFPLLAATDFNEVDGSIINALVNAGADLEQTNYQGDTALIFAATWWSNHSVKNLLKAGANPNTQNKNTGNTAIHATVGDSWLVDNIHFLIDAGADVNIQNNRGYTPIFTAIGNSIIPNIKALATAGADLNIVGLDGFKPLSYAKSRGNKKVIDLLINLGAKD